MLNKNLNMHLKYHKNKDKQKPYGLIDPYKKFTTVIKARCVPFTIVTEATLEYNRKCMTITEETRKCCQNFSKRKMNDMKVLNRARLVRKPKERTHNRLDSPAESPVLLFRIIQPYNGGSLGFPTY